MTDASASGELLREEPLAPPSEDTAPLRLERVTKRFGEVQALTDISLRVERRQIAVIIGGSGAGKTTLLRALIGLSPPSSGRILVEGTDIVGLDEHEMRRVRKRFGMVFQQAALLDSLTVLDNIALPLREHTRLSEEEIRSRVADKLEALDLGRIEERLPSEISGGMRKRVGVARALILEPSILLYDEPTSGLDPIGARRVDELIVATRDRFGVTSLLISHDMAEAQTIADQLFVLDGGKLVDSGTVDELRAEENGLARRFFDASLVSAGA